MAVDYLPQPNNAYSEDVSTLAAGTAIITRPCQVWKITASLEGSGNVVLNISDDNATYSNANRKDKICFSGPDSETISYPHGLNCTRGLCVTSNLAGVDVSVSYD